MLTICITFTLVTFCGFLVMFHQFFYSLIIFFFWVTQIRVNGPDTAPVYKFLKATSNGFLGTRIKWNFTKFLVDKEGVVINRYGPSTTPLSIEVRCPKQPHETHFLDNETALLVIVALFFSNYCLRVTSKKHWELLDLPLDVMLNVSPHELK